MKKTGWKNIIILLLLLSFIVLCGCDSIGNDVPEEANTTVADSAETNEVEISTESKRTEQTTEYPEIEELPEEFFGMWKSGYKVFDFLHDGTWRTENKVLELLPDGTGVFHTDSNLENIVWILQNDRLLVTILSSNIVSEYERVYTGSHLEFLVDDAGIYFTPFNILLHHDIAENQDADEWLHIAFGWDDLRTISIPSAWYAFEFVDGDYTPNSYLELFGTGVAENIRMYSYVSPIGNPQMILDEADFHERFEFDDGHVGYVLEDSYGISWLHVDGGNLVLSLYHDGNRHVFTDNEELILQIARSLRTIISET